MDSMKANFVKYPTHWNFLKDLWRSLSLCCRAKCPYRNVLLFFPYGDTRGHSGLSVCWTLLVSTVRRVQSITYNNRNNSMCHRETEREWVCVTDREKERENMWVGSCVSEETGIDSAAEHTESTVHSHVLRHIVGFNECSLIWHFKTLTKVVTNKLMGAEREGGREGVSRLAGRTQRIKYSLEHRRVLLHHLQPARESILVN